MPKEVFNDGDKILVTTEVNILHRSAHIHMDHVKSFVTPIVRIGEGKPMLFTEHTRFKDLVVSATEFRQAENKLFQLHVL